MTNLTVQQIENVVIDEGMVYINYQEVDERDLAPLKGGSTFVVEQEIKDIEYDGMRGKTKGMRRVITENAYATLNLLGLSQENLKLALAGAIMDPVTQTITNGTGTIPVTDYLKNIVILAKTMGGKYKVIWLFNAMSDNGLSANFVDKDEAVVQLNMAAHYDPSSLTSPIYKIDEIIIVLVNVTSAVISGTPKVGETLTAVANVGATNKRYQWLVADTSGGTYTEISGRTAPTLLLGAGQLGKFIKVRISGDNESTITSAATTVVLA